MQRILEFVSYKENTPSFEDIVYKKSFGDKKISGPFTFHSSICLNCILSLKIYFIPKKIHLDLSVTHVGISGYSGEQQFLHFLHDDCVCRVCVR
jgi:hypothetical protein